MAEEATEGGVGLGVLGGVRGSERVSVSFGIGVSSPLGRRSRSSGWSSRSRRLHQTDSKQFYSATYTAAVRPWTPRRDT